MPTQPLEESEASIQQLAQANGAFALDLYRQLAAIKGNLFFSPHSISLALAMTYAGAAGETAGQMAQALHFELPADRLAATFTDLQSAMAGAALEGEVELSSASALWLQDDYPLQLAFLELMRGAFQAGIQTVDYAQPETARQAINAWIEAETRGRIQDLLQPGVIDPLTRLVLTNAIYFKGLWANQFDPDETAPALFWNTSDTAAETPMMYQKAIFNYAQLDGLQIIELPYRGDQLSMLILLPYEIDGLPQLESSLSAENLALGTAGLRPQEVRVYLPRFQVSAEFRLDTTLQALGMLDAFTKERADFSAMDPANMLYISAVLHKAFCEVNEQGSEAAAATAVIMTLRALPMSPVFRADHPFIFLIRHKASGAILFLGRLTTVEKE